MTVTVIIMRTSLYSFAASQLHSFGERLTAGPWCNLMSGQRGRGYRLIAADVNRKSMAQNVKCVEMWKVHMKCSLLPLPVRRTIRGLLSKTWTITHSYCIGSVAKKTITKCVCAVLFVLFPHYKTKCGFNLKVRSYKRGWSTNSIVCLPELQWEKKWVLLVFFPPLQNNSLPSQTFKTCLNKQSREEKSLKKQHSVKRTEIQ